MPCSCCDLVVMTLEAIELAVCLPDIEDLEFVVFTASQEPVSIDRVPADHLDRVVVRLNLVEALPSASWVPYLDEGVLTASQNERLRWVPIT